MINYKQLERIDRMYKQPLFLIDFQKIGTDNNHDSSTYIFKISGSTANLYTVVVDDDGDINCDCPDSSSWAARCDCKCKHCCFVWIRVMGQDGTTILDNSQININEICQSLSLNFTQNNRLVNMEFHKRYTKSKITGNCVNHSASDKFIVSKEIDEDDDCPICFESLCGNIECQQCPTCNNIIHTRCMKKWLQVGNKTCVYCRSKVWTEIIPKTTQNLSKSNSKYLNLAD